MQIHFRAYPEPLTLYPALKRADTLSAEECPSIYSFIYGEPGVYPKRFGAHPRQDASLLQGTIVHTPTHPFTHYRQFKSCQSAHNACLWAKEGYP